MLTLVIFIQYISELIEDSLSVIFVLVVVSSEFRVTVVFSTYIVFLNYLLTILLYYFFYYINGGHSKGKRIKRTKSPQNTALKSKKRNNIQDLKSQRLREEQEAVSEIFNKGNTRE